MAKVIRPQWVFRKDNKWVRYLPRRHDGIVGEYDYKKYSATYEDFCQTQEESPAASTSPSKLWLAWLYRELNGEPRWTRARVHKLFGIDYKPGRMEIFPNTPSYNEELWNIKHLIELKPVTFPNGEPTEADITTLQINPDGRCVVCEKNRVNEADLVLYDAKKQYSSRELSRKLNQNYYGFKDVFEKNVYTPSNISIMK
ncbi:unnamed protein product, partial [Mesorhabditis belari]|uniref:39S ribosomal protein L30, mitochondrial n=1 Tax=Mesorhabditis belari TaxID=2138241 RepID=A0AAF3EZ64_9BILA